MAAAKIPDDFELITALQNAKARAEDAQFHQDAVAGRETGHGHRHHIGEKARRSANEKERTRDRAMSALDVLLTDPVYRAQYEAFGTFLGEVETKSEHLMAQAEAAHLEAADQLRNIIDAANRLPYGTRVYRAADGRVIDEHGRVVGNDEAAAIVWKDGAPTFEDYQKAKQRAEEAAQMVDDVRRLQVEIGAARHRWEDKDDPITSEEMETWRDRIQRLEHSIEERVPVPDQAALPEPDTLRGSLPTTKITI